MTNLIRLPPTTTMTARYTHDELMALSKDKGPLFDGSARQALVWAAATLDAADLAVRETQAEAAAMLRSQAAEIERLREDAARWNFVTGNGGEDWAVCKWNTKVYEDNWEPIQNYVEIDAARAALGQP